MDTNQTLKHLRKKLVALESPKVLVVEDDVNYVEMLGKWFVPTRYDVEFALTAEEALASMELIRYDVLWVDLMLPRMSGVDFIKRVKSLPNPPPIVVLTGNTESSDAREASKIGVVLVEKKPGSSEELFEFLKSINPNQHGQRIEKANN